MRRAAKSLLATVVVLFAAGAALLAKPAWLVPLVEQRIGAQTGRPAQIGDIDLRIGRCLHVAVNEIRIANPDWARSPALIDGERLSACVAWLPLLAGRLDLRNVEVDHTQLGLEREGGQATLAMGDRNAAEPGRVIVRHIAVRDSGVHFRDASAATELQIAVAGGVGEGDELQLDATGQFRGAPLHITATSPALLPHDVAPLRFSANATMGRSRASASGAIALPGPAGLEQLDVEVQIAGDDLSELNRLGINLPATPPYTLAGQLAFADERWTFSSFEGRIGDSDIHGDLSYSLREPRPLLRADIRAQRLDFDDLGPLVGSPPKTRGGETASAEQRAQARQVAAGDRVLPDKPLGIDSWPRMDADVRFRAERVRRPRGLPLNGVSAHLLIDDATMRLQPLVFETAGGRIDADVVIEGRREPPRGSLEAEIENLELARLLPQLDAQHAAAGTLFGQLQLRASGDSIAGLAATANGELTLMVNGGHMSALLLEMAGLDAGEALLLLLTRGDTPVPLRCAIGDFTLADGVLTPQLAVVDTSDTVFLLDGTVSLGEETLDLKVTPQPKDRSLPVVRTPLSIDGHFNDPSVRPEAAPLLARGGAAVALALLNPLLAVIPLIETGPGEDSDCAAFARMARDKGVTTAQGAAAENG